MRFRKQLDTTFVKTIVRKVEDCSCPIQLKAYVYKYENYAFCSEITDVFREAIVNFKERFCGDSLNMAALEELEEILETNIKISKLGTDINARKNHKKIERALKADTTFFID